MRPVPCAPACVALLAVLASVSMASSVRAQDTSPEAAHRNERGALLRVHAGFGFRVGQFKDAGGGHSEGIGGGLSLGYEIDPNDLLYVDGAYHYFPLSNAVQGNIAKVIPVTLNLEIRIPTRGELKPWLGMGAGVYHVDQMVVEHDVQNDFGANLGLGLGSPVGKAGFFSTGFRIHYAWGRIHMRQGYGRDTDVTFVTFEAALSAIP